MEKAELNNAKWVSSGGKFCSFLLRKRFFAENIKKAEITIACLGFFEGYVNGKKISDDMFLSLNTDYHDRIPIQYDEVNLFYEEMAHRLYCPVYDITELLSNGQNTLGFILAPGWYERPHDACHYGYIKTAFSVKITHTDETIEYITSDGSEKYSESYVKKYDILNGEHLDFSSFDDNWNKLDFDDSAWAKVTLENEPETRLFVQDCPADRVIDKSGVSLVYEKGEKRVYDVGEIISGYPVFSLPAGGKISVRYGEKIDTGGELCEENIYLQHTEIIGGDKKRLVHSAFTWMCFRYFEVIGSCEVTECLKIHSNVAVTSDFSCSDDTLNWLYGAYIRTQLANMHCGIPSDCPHIERKGYTGDGQLVSNAMMTYLDAEKFMKKWIYDISDCQDRKTGHVQYTAPFTISGGGPGGWGGAIVFVPYNYYLHYKDKTVLEELYPQMLRYFDFLEAHSENDVVTSDIPYTWCLGEWCTPEQIILNDKDGVKLPPPYVNTYFYIKAMQLVLKIGEITGRHEQENMLKLRIDKKKAAMTALYFDEATGDFCKNAQGANAFAVEIGLGDDRTFKNMVEHYNQAKGYDTGIFGTYLVTRLLFEKGYPEIALKLLTSKEPVSFYAQKSMGATTILENWNGVRSQCHPMFGAVSDCLSEFILGIRQKDKSAGYENIIIEPMCMDIIETAKGHITVPNGEIYVEYNKSELILKIPENVTAEVHQGSRKVRYI